MDRIILNSIGKEILIKEIQNYYENFGSMNKNDFEVLIFYVLMESGYNGLSNFELSRLLRIPETKVKRLRYERDLKYNKASDTEYRGQKLLQLNNLLANVSLKNDGKYIEFVVEDIALRRFLDRILKSENRFSDSSFNSEVVKVDIKDLEILLRSTIENEQSRKKILSDAKKQIREDVNLIEILPSLIDIALKAGTALTDLSWDGLISLISSVPKVAKAIGEKLR